MSVRSFQARVECDKQTMEHLWRTHRVFNERLPEIIKILFKMKRGECGQNDRQQTLYKNIAKFILEANSQKAEYYLDSVNKRKTIWTPNSAKNDGLPKEDADEAVKLLKEGLFVFDKELVLGDIPGMMRQIVCRQSVEAIKSHYELLKIWEEEHNKWLKDKIDWESRDEHKKYLKLRDKFEEFEKSVGGKISKRRGRWHLYLKWLRENPDLAAWRGEKGIINPISDEALKRISKVKPNKKNAKEAEEFFKENPEIKELDKLHGEYENKFVRRRKTRKNPDGFDHKPTFTLPHPKTHPRWFIFNAPQTSPQGYLNLILPRKAGELGTIEIRLLTGEKKNGKYPDDWITIRYKADPRLSLMRPAKGQRVIRTGKNKGQTIDSDIYEYFDKNLNKQRSVKIRSAKLIFKMNPDKSPKAAYLYFACDVPNEPLTESAKKIQWIDEDKVSDKDKKHKKRIPPEGLVTCAVDLSMRRGSTGFATLCRYENGRPIVLRSRNLWIRYKEEKGRHTGQWVEGPDLGHIAKHKKEIRILRRKRGKPIKGQKSHAELQEHIDDMGEDRFKKAARAIINFALNTDNSAGKNGVYPRADVLLLEKLEGLIPDAEKERGINRALAGWNRRHLVERVKEMAEDAGFKFKKNMFEISPYGTSQVCSKCGTAGRRYSIVRNEETHQREIRFGFVEKLFACPNPNCKYYAKAVNADHNASVNLHKRFLINDKNFYDHKKHKAMTEAIENNLIDKLCKMHKIERISEKT